MSTYIGPYIKCTGYIKTKEILDVNACSNKDCSLHEVNTANVFCPCCGNSTGKMQICEKSKEEIDLYQASEGELHSVSPDYQYNKISIWIDNYSVKKFGRELDDYEEFAIDDNLIKKSQKETCKFRDTFEPMLEGIKSKYGDSFKYTIEYGVINY